jgi:hypothetical protein
MIILGPVSYGGRIWKLTGVAEGLARVHGLFTSFVAMGGARALDGGARAGILVLLSVVPDDPVV